MLIELLNDQTGLETRVTVKLVFLAPLLLGIYYLERFIGPSCQACILLCKNRVTYDR
jgi:hypothetical protein